MQIFYGNFTDASNVFYEFGVPLADQKGITLIFASYEQAGYEGSAFVIFVRNGYLFEVNGSHCSCNGLDSCWRPEETSVVALLARPNVPKEAKENLKEFYKNLMAFA